MKLVDLIGNTPLVRVDCFDTGGSELWLKLESANPGGSIKDRIGLSMIGAAEQSGALRPGGHLIEATAGNTGLGLALVAALRGYRLTLVIPDKMSQEKVTHLKALGAEVIWTRSDVGKGHPAYYQDMAQRIAQETGAYYVNQFENPANPLAHERTTAPEIWAQTGQQLDAVVCGVGSGGTITGMSWFFGGVAPEVDIVLADPKGSAKEGILAGTSSGVLIAAAVRYARERRDRGQPAGKIVTFVCDSGAKYLSKVYRDEWLIDQGLVPRTEHGDLRDVVVRRAGQLVDVTPDDALRVAYARMRLHDVSQLPVVDPAARSESGPLHLGRGALVGIVDESDLLVSALHGTFDRTVRDVMTTKLETLAPGASVAELAAVLDRGLVGVIVDNGALFGLVTRIDLVNYLRRRIA